MSFTVAVLVDVLVRTHGAQLVPLASAVSKEDACAECCVLKDVSTSHWFLCNRELRQFAHAWTAAWIVRCNRCRDDESAKTSRFEREPYTARFRSPEIHCPSCGADVTDYVDEELFGS